MLPFDKRERGESFFACLRRLKAGHFDLFVLEGTGVAAGMAAILGRLLYKRSFVLSSGDAVAPFLSASIPWGAPLFGIYERMLYRYCSGFIGWTPYLVGRALTLGAKRGVTIPGWAVHEHDGAELLERRKAIRERFGIPEDALVFGIAGALVWSKRYEYCYGSEMIRSALKANAGTYVLIVGDGSGLARLEEMAGDQLNKTIFLPGRVPREEVSGYLAAMDVGALPQSLDGVGSFRYSTKISEYRAVGLPFFTNQIPMAYDLDRNDLWRLEGPSPWSSEFIEALSDLMKKLTLAEVAARKSTFVPIPDFDRDTQIRRVTEFLGDILHDQ